VLYPLFGSPRLPKTEKSQQRKINLSGTVVRFSVPPFYDRWGSQRSFAEQFNLYSASDYLREDDFSPVIQCYTSRWDIKGAPLLKKNIGWIRFSVTVSNWKGKSNLFKRDSFVTAVTSYYEKMYGPKGVHTKDTYETFLEWKPDKINESQWIHYLNVKDPEEEPSQRLYWQIPLSDEHYLTFNFSYQIFNKKIGVHNAVKSFAQKIMHSVHVELSPSAQQQKEAAEKQWPGQRYSEHMEPLRWIRPKKDFMSIEEFLAEDDEL